MFEKPTASTYSRHFDVVTVPIPPVLRTIVRLSFRSVSMTGANASAGRSVVALPENGDNSVLIAGELARGAQIAAGRSDDTIDVTVEHAEPVAQCFTWRRQQ